MKGQIDRDRLTKDAYEIRKKILTCIMGAGGGHVGGSMSVADCLAALYGGIANITPENVQSPDRDKIILSKGHSGAALYAALAHHGFFPEEMLSTMNANGTLLPGHPDRSKLAGVEISTGSLGQGGSMAAGIAYADRLDNRSSKTYLILGDGELNEGQTWEALMFIAHHNLKNLVVIVDNNGIQCDGRLEDICRPFDLAEKFRAFGYDVIDVVRGNDVLAVYDALVCAQNPADSPVCVLLHTKKGAKLSCFEDRVSSHHCKLTPEQYRLCLDDIARDYSQMEV